MIFLINRNGKHEEFLPIIRVFVKMANMNAKEILEVHPVYRVNNREENLNFFREVLGLKVLIEEGAMVELGGHKEKVGKLLLEESPMRDGFHAASSIKRHAQTVIQADASEIKQLLAKNLELENRIFKGATGFAFEAVSPEKDVFLVTSDNDLSQLTEVDKWNLSLELTADENFLGLSTFAIKEIVINVSAHSTFVFPKLTEILACHTDLSATDTWDIESLELLVSDDTDLRQLSQEFDETYLDKENRILSVQLSTGLELWFKK